jgi:hypothetical protein
MEKNVAEKNILFILHSNIGHTDGRERVVGIAYSPRAKRSGDRLAVEARFSVHA